MQKIALFFSSRWQPFFVGGIKLLAGLCPFLLLLSIASAGPTKVSFHESVEPLLKADCTGCHSKASPSSGLLLDSVEGLRKGGSKFGSRIIVPGKPEQSALIGYLKGIHQPQMPQGMPPLSGAQIRMLENWISQGAVIDPIKLGWPYTPAPSVTPPLSSKTTMDLTNPIDKFVVAKLQSKGLHSSPPAPKAVLLRRIYLDLLGVPPSPEEVNTFFADASPNAYENLVDRLLADPRYGERWARHWLDLVRFAETHGFEADNVRPRAWRYRDYVIRSLNADKPYNRFLQEQIAGDELWPDDSDAWIATGFLRLGTYDELSADHPNRRQDQLNDITDTVSSAFLGMTVGCARCHDHKYDRITQRDYYRLQAFFTNMEWTDHRLISEVDPTTLVEKRKYESSKIEQLVAARKTLRDHYRKAMGNASANDEEIEKFLDTPVRKTENTEWQKLKKDEESAHSRLTPIDTLAEVVTDSTAQPPTQHVLLRGSLATPGDLVTPGFIAAFCGGKEVEATFTPPSTNKTSGARSALAQWLTSPQNPMTARVLVNRLWQHHFGVGLVETPSDFGRNGAKTMHPQLLDWLSQEFVRQNWSIKSIHRLIVTSKTYRQSVGVNPDAEKTDPQNRLFWRQNRQRLDAEPLRDSILAVSGGLNPERGGPSIYPQVGDEVLATGSTHKWGNSPEDQQRRRTIYVFQRRSLMLPITEVFDGPDLVNTCPRRNRTTIAPQALALFNGDFTWSEARRFATRIQSEATSTESRIDRAFRLALVRRPSAHERLLANNFIQKKRALHLKEGVADLDNAVWSDFCHVLLNTNEFVYVE